jgi:hypothetical protein
MGAGGSLEARVTPLVDGRVKVALEPAVVEAGADVEFPFVLTNTDGVHNTESQLEPEEETEPAVRAMIHLDDSDPTQSDDGALPPPRSLHASFNTSFNMRGVAAGALLPATPTVALLQAAPLVHGAQPMELLDLKAERDAIVASLQRAEKRVRLVCDACTTRRLRSLLTEGVAILRTHSMPRSHHVSLHPWASRRGPHDVADYSGHGISYVDANGAPQTVLAFEDGHGGTHALEVHSRPHRPSHHRSHHDSHHDLHHPSHPNSQCWRVRRV